MLSGVVRSIPELVSRFVPRSKILRMSTRDISRVFLRESRRAICGTNLPVAREIPGLTTC